MNATEMPNTLGARNYADGFSKAAVVLAASMTRVIARDPLGDSQPFLPAIVHSDERVYVFLEGKRNLRPDFSLLAPYVINAAFALELYLKLLLTVETSKWPQGHDLDELYSQLTIASRTAIEASFAEFIVETSDYGIIRDRIRAMTPLSDFEWDMRVLLQNSAKAFVDWRYVFEGRKSWFAGFWELRRSLVRQLDASQ